MLWYSMRMSEIEKRLAEVLVEHRLEYGRAVCECGLDLRGSGWRDRYALHQAAALAVIVADDSAAARGWDRVASHADLDRIEAAIRAHVNLLSGRHWTRTRALENSVYVMGTAVKQAQRNLLRRP